MLIGLSIIGPILLLSIVRSCISVKGCTVILRNQQSTMKKAVCSNPNEILKSIPSDLPEALIELEISFQNIEIIYNMEFLHLTKLQYLSITSSNVHTIQEQAFVPLSNLKYLSLSNNSLIISSQSPFGLSKHIFLPFLNLIKLDLSLNSIGIIPDFFFSHINQTLEILYLSNSKTEIILSKSSLMHLGSLKRLYLDSSQITTFNSDLENSLNLMVKIHEILIIGNLWQCDCQLKWFIKWIFKRNNLINRKKIKFGNLICSKPIKMKNRNLLSDNFHDKIDKELFCIPQPVTSNSTISIYIKQNISLSCIFKNLDDNQNIIWKNQKNIFINPNTFDKRFIITETKGKYRKSNLTIMNISKIDEGIWKCSINFNNKPMEIDFLINVEIDRNSNISPFSNKSSIKNATVYALVFSSLTIIFIIILIITIYYCKYYKKNLFSIKTRTGFNFFTKKKSKNQFYKNMTQKSLNPFSITKDLNKSEEKNYDNVPLTTGFYINFTKKKNEQNFSTLNCLDCQNYAIVDDNFRSSSNPICDKTKSPRFWYLDDSIDGIDYLPTTVDFSNDMSISNLSNNDSAFITRIPSRTPCPVHSSQVSISNFKKSLSELKQNKFNRIEEIEACPVHGKKSSQNSYSVHFSIPDQELNTSKSRIYSTKKPEKTLKNSFSKSSIEKSKSKNYFPVYLSSSEMQLNDDTLYRQYSCLTNSVV